MFPFFLPRRSCGLLAVMAWALLARAALAQSAATVDVGSSIAQSGTPSPEPAAGVGAGLAAKTAELESALDALNTWLGAGATGDGWREFLLLRPVKEKLAAHASSQELCDDVGRSWAQFATQTDLEATPFVRARAALGAWWIEYVVPSNAERLNPEELGRIFDAGKQLFVLIGKDAVEHDQKILSASLSRLEAYLSGGKAPDGLTADGLKLAALRALISPGAPADFAPPPPGAPIDLQQLKARNHAFQRDQATLGEIEDLFWAKGPWTEPKPDFELPEGERPKVETLDYFDVAAHAIGSNSKYWRPGQPLLASKNKLYNGVGTHSPFWQSGLQKPLYLDVGNALRQYRLTREAAWLDNPAESLAWERIEAQDKAKEFKEWAEKYAGSDVKQRKAILEENNRDFTALWNELEREQPDPEKLGQFAKAYKKIQAFEGGVFETMGEPLVSALERFSDLLKHPGFTRLQLDFRNHLAGLNDDFAKLLKEPSAIGADHVNRRLSWLVDHGQALPLREALRPFETRPNLFAEISESFAASRVHRDVNEPVVVSDNILGTSIRGKGVTVGKTSLVEFVPDARHASFLTQLSAVTSTNTVGVNGPATVRSTGATTLKGSAIIDLDASGATARRPTMAAATSTRINGVATQSNLQIVQRIATNKVYQSKAQAEQISAQHAAARATAQIIKGVEKFNESFLEKFRYPLERRRAFPDVLLMRTTDDRIFVKAIQALRGEVAAVDKPPHEVDQGDALRVQVHESAVNNWAQAMLSAATITKTMVDAWPKDDSDNSCKDAAPAPTGGAESTETAPKVVKDNWWSMTFDNERPVAVSIEQGQLKLTLRLAHVEAINKSRSDQLDNHSVTVLYKVSQSGDGVRLERQTIDKSPEGCVIKSYDRPWETKTDPGSRRVIKRRLDEELFPKAICTKGLKLTDDHGAVSWLPLRFLNLDRGWAALGWDLPTSETTKSVAEVSR